MTPDAPIPSPRISRARAAATQRLHRQRALLRPLGWAVIGVVAATTITTGPGPGLSGIAAAVSVALIAYAAATAVAIGDRFVDRPGWVQGLVLVLMGAAGVVLVALQPGVPPAWPPERRSGWPSPGCRPPPAPSWGRPSLPASPPPSS